MPVGAQLGAQGVVVVDLAVLGGPDAAALVGERLVAALDVDDAQAAGAERQAVLEHEAVVVGPAVLDDARHPREDLAAERGARPAVERERSGDAAHG